MYIVGRIEIDLSDVEIDGPLRLLNPCRVPHRYCRPGVIAARSGPTSISWSWSAESEMLRPEADFSEKATLASEGEPLFFSEAGDVS